jgi:hypothetical protein
VRPTLSVVRRVISIAAAPSLAGEKGADYAAMAERIVGVSGPRGAIEELLDSNMRDYDLTWGILRLRRIKAGMLKASIGDTARTVLNSLGHTTNEACST